MKKKELLILFVALSAIAISRLVMPWNNFSPIGAIALMGGALIGRKTLAFALPLLSLFISDLVLTQVSSAHSSYLFSSTFFMVYGAFALTVLLGISLSKGLSFAKVLGGGLIATAIFFFVTNTGAWMYFGMYPQTAEGLMAAWAAGIPFLQNALVSQLLFSTIIYFGWMMVTSKKPVLA